MGGGIYNTGSLTLLDTSVVNNHANGTTDDFGGGIYNTGDLLMERSSVGSNRSELDGGGIYHDGTSLALVNSSVLFNAASRNGGGIYATAVGSSTIQLTNATIAENAAEFGSAFSGDGGGLYLAGPGATLHNTLVAGNVTGYSQSTYAPSDIFGSVGASSGHNLVTDAATSGGMTDGDSGNIVGDGGAGTRNVNDVLLNTSTDLLDFLNNVLRYGGKTPTRALRHDSPAIDAGSNALAMENNVPLVGDQRSELVPRIFDGDFEGGAVVDIGAFEVAQIDLTVDSVDRDGIGLTLDEAIELAGQNPKYVHPQTGQIAWHNRVTIPSTLPDLTRNQTVYLGGILEIVGPGADLFQIDATGYRNGIEVHPTGAFSNEASVKLSGMTIMGADENGIIIFGLYSFELTHLELRDVHILDNGSAVSGLGGGGVASPWDGNVSLHVIDSVITGNGSKYGGIHLRNLGNFYNVEQQPLLIVQNSTVSNNRSEDDGGGLYARINFTDGDSTHAPFIIEMSTFSGNEAADKGGGIYLTTGTLYGTGTPLIQNNTVSGNTALDVGGAFISVIENGPDRYYEGILHSTIVDNMGGGILWSEMHHSIVAGNTPVDVVSTASTPDSSYNIVGDAASAGGLVDGVNGNIVGDGGVGVLDLATILDPLLADNGGSTLTHALVAGSPAIDRGDPTHVAGVDGVPVDDQRGVGFPRVQYGRIDIGAVEDQESTADPLLQFDFGPRFSPVADDFTQVTKDDLYNSGDGYGWTGSVFGEVDRGGSSDDEQRDFVFTRSTAEFQVDLYDGPYDVTVLMGDATFLQDNMQLSLEGAIVDTVTTAAGVFHRMTYRVNVVDGQLNVGLTALGGTFENALLNSLVIRPNGLPTPFVVDDSDPRFSTEGSWTTATPPHAHNGSLRHSAQGSGENVARWVMTGLAPGNYRVSATWPEHVNRATNSPFTILDAVGGRVLHAIPVNQELAPDDFSAEGSDWEDLAIVNVTDGTLVVEVSNAANGFVIADAIRVEATLEPATPPLPEVFIQDDGDAGFATTGNWTTPPTAVGYQSDLRHNAAGNGSDTALWTFDGLTPGNYLVSATWYAHANRASNAPFTIRDGIGGSELEIAQVNQRLAPDDLNDDGSDWEHLAVVTITGTELVVELSDDANGYVVADAIRIEATTQTPLPSGTIIDNGDTGFAASSGWNSPALSAGHNGDLLHAPAGTGSAIATWSFTDLTPGEYVVAATWTAHANRATNAPFTIFDGTAGPELTTIEVNQEQAPDDFYTFGSEWETLTTITITGTELVVQLSNDANGYVIADAVRITPSGSPS